MIGFVSGLMTSTSRDMRRVGVSGRRARRSLVSMSETNRDQSSTTEVDSTAAADFLEKIQSRIEDYTEQVKNADLSDLQNTATVSSKQLANNFLAGEWLQRGESYGVIQIIAALLILRSQGSLDGLCSFLFGPLVLLTGAIICGKSAYDLGFKQLSIWPKPVPDGELQTMGLYEYVRHPIYAGVLLSSFGFAAVTGSPARFAITMGLAFFFSKKIDLEETFLLERYGEVYEEYQELVPFKIVPKVF